MKNAASGTFLVGYFASNSRLKSLSCWSKFSSVWLSPVVAGGGPGWIPPVVAAGGGPGWLPPVVAAGGADGAVADGSAAGSGGGGWEDGATGAASVLIAVDGGGFEEVVVWESV